MTRYLALFTLLFFSVSNQAQHSTINLFIGTYTKTCDSQGIYLYEFDTYTGETKVKASTESIVNPSFLTISKDKQFLYATNEDGNNSKISAFRFTALKNTIELINQVDAHGADPCHIINDEQKVIVATYSGGTISVFEKQSDNSLKFQQAFMHKGSSINPERQEKAHLHMLQFSPDGKFILATDLGSDFIYVYQYNPLQRNNTLEVKKAIKVRPGSGPRHLTFSRDGKFVYLVQELDGTVSVFKYGEGNLELIQETSLVKQNFKGKTSAADIHISPDGKFLYATNRGDANTISCFEIKKNGKLKLQQTTSTMGKGPRNFCIDPTGNFLLVAHQYTNDVVIFKIDKATGKLSDSGKKIELCSPVCLVFE
jgi:6-phosphogluconolactonase